LAPLSAWVQRNLAPDTVAFNQVLVNWYDPARGDYIGPHSDNTDGMTPGAPIVSVSYGGTRRFRVSPKVAGLKRLDIMVTNNSMLVMGGNMQQTHTHSITKPQRRDGATSPRINVTFRSFVPHLGP
jgi:alkylated DNA repair dioxygenase AlkB